MELYEHTYILLFISNREKHEENHQPAMHKGVVIKWNANQRYATTSITAFLLKELAKRHQVPIQVRVPKYCIHQVFINNIWIQEFLVRNDSPCGSTIGPILSSHCGIRTIDIGCPQLSMHSIREMASVDDLGHAVKLFVVLSATTPLILLFRDSPYLCVRPTSMTSRTLTSPWKLIE